MVRLKFSVAGICLIMMISLCACSKTGDQYYTDNTGEEGFLLNTDTSKKIIAANVGIIDTELILTIGYRLIDTSAIFEDSIENIDFKINDVSANETKNKFFRYIIDTFPFINFKDIPDLRKKINSKRPVEFVYIFNRNDIENIDKLHIELTLTINHNRRKYTVTKDLYLNRHYRYRSWFAY